MKRVVILAIVVFSTLGCRKTEPDEVSALVRVVSTDPCRPPGVFLNIHGGPQLGSPFGKADSMRNVVMAINLPDSLIRQGLFLRIRFRLATENEKLDDNCVYFTAPGPGPTQIKIFEIQR